MAGSQLIAQGIDRRRAILRFVKTYVRRHGHSPSIEEIAVGVALASKSAARHHVDMLVQQKFLAITPGKYRSLRVINDGRYPS